MQTDPSKMTDAELNAAVAERVMGWRMFPYVYPPHQRGVKLQFSYCPPELPIHVTSVRELPNYATTWEGAGKVVDKMNAEGHQFRPGDTPRDTCEAALRAVDAMTEAAK